MLILENSPKATFPKWTIKYVHEDTKELEVLKVANTINPSDLLQVLGIDHIYKILAPEVSDDKKKN